MKKYYIIIISVICFNVYICQNDGPGGVGNSSTLQTWLDASTISLSDGSAISTWSDVSGNNNDFTQASASIQPIFSLSSSINSKPAVAFSSDHLISSSIANLETNTITWIFVSNTPSSTLQVITRTSYNSGAGIGSYALWGSLYNTLYKTHTRNSGGGVTLLDASYNVNGQIFTNIWNGSVSFDAYQNESSLGSLTGATANPSGHNFTVLGANNNTNQYPFTGDIAEFIVYNTNINQAQRIIIDNYLSSKYSISLSSNDKFSYDATYGNELAGIGREDVGNEHLDAQGTDIVRITASSLDDADYLLWGNDNNALNSTSLGIPSTYAAGQRFERTWRVQETGEVGDLTISFDVSSNGFGLTPDYDLLIDTDDDFTSGATIISGSYLAGIVTFNVTAAQLEDSYYFTLSNPETDIISIVDGQDWSNTSTWNCTCVPNSGSDVTIDAGHTVMVTGNESANTLDVSSTGSLNIAGGSLNANTDITFNTNTTNFINGILDVENNITNDGTINSSGGFIFIGGNWDNTSGNYICATHDSVTFDGAGSQLIDGATDWNILTVDCSSLQVNSGQQNIYSGLNLVSGTFNTGNLTTLISNASGTAMMDDIESSTITGNLTVERYLSMGSQGWREITSPVQGTVIDDWENNGVIFSGFNNTNFASFSFVNALKYEEGNAAGDKNNGWVNAVNALADATGPTNGWRVWMDATNYTLSVSGVPYTGPQTINVTQGGGAGSSDDENGWNLIGNPFPCTIDVNSIIPADRPNVDNIYYIWNATLGNYGYYSPGSGAVNNVTNEIASSQAFWVHCNSNTGSLTLRENIKTRTDNTFIKSFSNNDEMRIKITGNINSYSDEIIINRVAGASDFFDTLLEFPKLYTDLTDDAPSLSVITNDSVHVGLASINNNNNSDLKLNAFSGRLAQGNYTLDFDIPPTFMQGGCITLEDLYTGIITDLRNDSSYTFASDTSVSPRFIIHIYRDYDVISQDVSCHGLDDGEVIIYGNSISGYDFNITDLLGNLLYSATATNSVLTFNNLPIEQYLLSTNYSGACQTNIDDFTISEPNQLTADFSVNSDTIYIDSVSYTGQLQVNNQSIDATSYIWDFDDGTLNTDLHNVHFYNNVGLYNVTLTASDSLSSCIDYRTQIITVLDKTTEIIDNSSDNKISCYKDNNRIILDFNVNFASDYNVKLYNTLGQLLFINDYNIQGNKIITLPNLKLSPQILFIIVSNETIVEHFEMFND